MVTLDVGCTCDAASTLGVMVFRRFVICDRLGTLRLPVCANGVFPAAFRETVATLRLDEG